MTRRQADAFVAKTSAKADPAEISALKRELRAVKRKLSEQETGLSLIMAAIKESYSDPPDLVIPPPPRLARRKAEEIAIVHVSDTQFGKRTPTYDSSVCETRLMRLARKIVAITTIRRSAASIRELRVYLGGDLVEGEDIFPGQAHEIDQVLLDQAVLEGPAMFARFLLYLLQHFERIHVCDVPGNHGRNGRRGNAGAKRTNWDKVLAYALDFILCGHEESPRKDLKGRLSFTHAEDWYVVDRVYDWGCLLIHGDQIRGGFAGFPWYGVSKKAWGWIDAIREPWDYLWLGHYHTYASAVLNQRTFLANGTTESSNVYAQEQLAAAGFPCQRLAYFDPQHGLIADNQVFLMDAGERLPFRRRAERWTAPGE